MEKNKWWTIRDQSLAVYTRAAGFDLAIFDEYSKPVKVELQKRAIKEAMDGIQSDFLDAAGFDLSGITRGVYVISLSNPLAVQYRSKWSQVIYIGMGNIVSRINSHFSGRLFDFMQSLSGTNFDFHFACPKMDGEELYYKHVEHLMLEYFCDYVGGLDDKFRFPILNSNAGSNKKIEGGDQWWAPPLRATGKRPRWLIKPTEHSGFGTLD